MRKRRIKKMFFSEFLFVLLITVILTAVFAVGIRRRTTWNILLPFFIILFLATWATGIWIRPIGPVIGGIFWLPFLVIGLLYAFLLAAFIPSSRPPQTSREKVRQRIKEQEVLSVLNVFFWLVVIGLIIAIIWRYLYIH
jgi:hypothetical protein